MHPHLLTRCPWWCDGACHSLNTTTQFDLSRVAGAKFKLRGAPNAHGELASAKLPGGGRVSLVAEDASLAAQLYAVAVPSKHGGFNTRCCVRSRVVRARRGAARDTSTVSCLCGF